MMGEIVYLPGAVRGGWRDTGLHFPAGLAMIAQPTGGRPVPVASAWAPRRNETVCERG